MASLQEDDYPTIEFLWKWGQDIRFRDLVQFIARKLRFSGTVLASEGDVGLDEGTFGLRLIQSASANFGFTIYINFSHYDSV